MTTSTAKTRDSPLGPFHSCHNFWLTGSIIIIADCNAMCGLVQTQFGWKIIASAFYTASKPRIAPENNRRQALSCLQQQSCPQQIFLLPYQVLHLLVVSTVTATPLSKTTPTVLHWSWEINYMFLQALWHLRLNQSSLSTYRLHNTIGTINHLQHRQNTFHERCSHSLLRLYPLDLTKEIISSAKRKVIMSTSTSSRKRTTS